MDSAVIGLLAITAIVAAAVYAMRPRKVLPLEDLIGRLHTIHADPKLTAAQKRHLEELAYHSFERLLVSLVGGVHDVFPNGAIVMKTTLRELPLVGVELASVGAGELREFHKGRAVTLRAMLPPWKDYTDVVGLPVAFREARLYYGGRWYAVKSTYRVRDPSEPKTGEFAAFRPEPRTHKTGEFRAMKTVEIKKPQ